VDEALSVPELVEAIAHAVGRPTPVLARIPRDVLDKTPLADNPGRTFRAPLLWPGITVSSLRAKEELGWCPTPLGDWLPLVAEAVLAEASAGGWPLPVTYGQRSLEARLGEAWLELLATAGEELTAQCSEELGNAG